MKLGAHRREIVRKSAERKRKGKNINMIQQVPEYAVEDKSLFSLEVFPGPWKACLGQILTF